MAVRKLYAILAVSIVVVLWPPGMKAQKKQLTKEDIIELLTGDVEPGRVAALVRERGVSFNLTREFAGLTAVSRSAPLNAGAFAQGRSS